MRGVNSSVRGVPTQFRHALRLSCNLILLHHYPTRHRTGTILLPNLLLPRLPRDHIPLKFVDIDSYRDAISLRFSHPLHLNRYLYPLHRLFPSFVKRQFFSVFILNFRSLILLLSNYMLTLTRGINSTKLCTIHVLPIGLSHAFLLFNSFTIGFLTTPLLLLIPSLRFFVFKFNVIHLASHNVPINFNCFLFHLCLFNFLLLLNGGRIDTFGVLLSHRLL